MRRLTGGKSRSLLILTHAHDALPQVRVRHHLLCGHCIDAVGRMQDGLAIGVQGRRWRQAAGLTSVRRRMKAIGHARWRTVAEREQLIDRNRMLTVTCAIDKIGELLRRQALRIRGDHRRKHLRRLLALTGGRRRVDKILRHVLRRTSWGWAIRHHPTDLRCAVGGRAHRLSASSCRCSMLDVPRLICDLLHLMRLHDWSLRGGRRLRLRLQWRRLRDGPLESDDGRRFRFRIEGCLDSKEGRI